MLYSLSMGKVNGEHYHLPGQSLRLSGCRRLGQSLTTQPQIGIRWVRKHDLGRVRGPDPALIRKYLPLLIRSGVEVAGSCRARFLDGTLLW